MNIFEIRDVVYADLLYYKHIDIKQGVVTFIQGESGSGKSSLLRLLNCSKSYDSGQIMCFGKLITEYEPLELRRDVSLVAQEVFLIDGSIEENFKFFYDARGLQVPNEEHMQTYLQMACLPITTDKLIKNLSGGEKQRVYLAIFLSFEPRVLMLDEPTASLDEAMGQKLLYNIVQHVRERKCTVIIVSHSQELARMYADETVYITKEVRGDA